MLAEYREHLPMTARQVFYRLVGRYGFPKDEQAYDRLQEYLNRARRTGMIPMEAIRDDRALTMGDVGGYAGPAAFWAEVKAGAGTYHRPLDEGQPRVAEVWIEATGMMPMVAAVTREYGVPVYGSGGFESVAAKHDAAQRIARRQVPITVLSVGDLDPSGLSIVDAAADDVAVFVERLDARSFLSPEKEVLAAEPLYGGQPVCTSAQPSGSSLRPVPSRGGLSALPPAALPVAVRRGPAAAARVRRQQRQRTGLHHRGKDHDAGRACDVRGASDFQESLLQFLLVPGGHATEHIAGSGGREGVQYGWMELEYVADLVQRALCDLKRHEGLDGVARGMQIDVGPVSGDHAGGFHLLDPGLDRRSRYAGQSGQLQVPRAGVALEGVQQGDVQFVEATHAATFPQCQDQAP